MASMSDSHRSNLRSRDGLSNGNDVSSLDIETQLPRMGDSTCADVVVESISLLASNANGSGDNAESNSKMKTSGSGPSTTDPSSSNPTTISKTGLQVLVFLAFQNCSKNLLLRFVMKDKPQFLTSAAVISGELVKLVLSLLYILLVDRKSLSSIVTYLRGDYRNTMLMAVPAAAYSIQGTLEYVALTNIDASKFSVLVQTKLLATAGCAVLLLRKKIKKVQFISLVLLTIGVMLCNMEKFGKEIQPLEGSEEDPITDSVTDPVREQEGWTGGLASADATTKGVLATLGISLCSGFASVYTEKVMKSKRPVNSNTFDKQAYGLAYTQVQLAGVSLIIMGVYCTFADLEAILEKGMWYGFNGPAYVAIFNSAIGGLTVAAVLKFADAVLKGYATAVSVILTGVLSMVLFGTHLNTVYFMGIANVTCAVLLYSANDLDRNMC